MSFDWLNVPGLNNDESNVTIEQTGQMPPSVSFDFGTGSAVTLDTDESTNTSRIMPTYSLSDSNVETVGGSRLSHTQYPSHAAGNQLNGTHQRLHQNETHGHQHNGQLSQQNKGASFYKETSEELKVPLSLSRSQLTRDEVRTYLRWYNYITLKTHSKLVRLIDVFKFLSNFNISEELRERIAIIFRTCKNALNIGQFFAVLRLVSKALIEHKMPNRRMILEKAPIPKPRPILSSGDRQEVYEEVEDEPGDSSGQKVDFDSFASLLLTGKSVRKRIRRRITNAADKNKRVRFSEHLTFQEAPSSDGLDAKHEEQVNDSEETDKLDLSLPMDQLLKRMAKRKEKNTALVSSMPTEQPQTEEEREVLEEMKDSLSHFKQIQTVDFASMAPASLPSIVLDGSNTGNSSEPPQVTAQSLEPLKPTSTGSANYLFRQHYNQPQGAEVNNQAPLLPLKPTATGSANYLMREHAPSIQQEMRNLSPSADGSGPVGGLQPLKPTATGSGNYLVKQQYNQQFSGPNVAGNPASSMERLSSPQYNGQFTVDNHLQAPQPHVSMQQQLSPQVTPQTQSLQQPQGVLSASNPAGNYFQSLLSHSPSPNPSSTNLPTMATGSPYQSMLGDQAPTSQSRATYNNGYQYSSPLHNQQQVMFAGSSPMQQQQQQQQQQQKTQQFLPQQTFSTGFAAPRPYTVPTSASPQSGDILSDLQSLQRQVDALQNSYSRR